MTDHSPFFVFGPQKCGSSLLSTLLEQHPGIGIATDTVMLNVFITWLTQRKAVDLKFHPDQDAPEKYFVGNGLRQDLFKAHAGYDEVKWFLSDLFERYFTTSVGRLNQLIQMQGEAADVEFLSAEELMPYKHGLRLDPLPLLQLAREGCLWTDILTAIIRQLAHTGDADAVQAFGEKTPGHMRFAHHLAASFPDGRFIFIIRNPIANIASYYKRNNAGFGIGQKGDINRAIGIYKGFIDPFLNYYRGNRERFLVLKFEDLIDDTQASMDRVFAHLGVDSVPVQQQFGSGSKGAYVGNKVDKDRASGAYSILSEGEQELVTRSLDYVFDEFYPQA